MLLAVVGLSTGRAKTSKHKKPVVRFTEIQRKHIHIFAIQSTRLLDPRVAEY